MKQRRSAAKEEARKEGCSPWAEPELDRLVAEATVDCYNETEKISGLYTMIEDNLAVPFETIVFGATVVVERIDLTDRDDIVAICKRGSEVRKIRLADLPLPRAQQKFQAHREAAMACKPTHYRISLGTYRCKTSTEIIRRISEAALRTHQTG